MTDADADLIQQALSISSTTGYSGVFRPLGGGEMNNTYALTFENGPELVLRIARHPEQTSLEREAHALASFKLNSAPHLVFFDSEKRISNKLWILETFIPGKTVSRLSPAQFHQLGKVLAEVHAIQGKAIGVQIWQTFLEACASFGDEQALCNHPDTTLRALIVAGKDYFERTQPAYNHVVPSLVHGDATPSNVLTQGDNVSLIDWEFSRFNDPMAEFSTIYYDDMAYNQGKWRIQITSEEREALFEGYRHGGGEINEERIQLWMIFDKLGAAIFLYWRLHQSSRPATEEQRQQYQLDLDNLIVSLKNSLSV